MDVLTELGNVDKVEPVSLIDIQVPEEIVYNAIIRTHLIYFIIGGVFTLLMVLL